MSDDSDLLKAASEGATAGAVRAALEPFIAPIAESTQTITDLVRYQRWKIQIWIAQKARIYLEERGIEPNAVPLKILVPLLDAASLEDDDDEDMQARWAALLANAAAGENGAYVSPAFPRILAELTPPEAALLQSLAEREEAEGEGLALFYWQSDPAALVLLQNLERLSLVDVRPPNPKSVQHRGTLDDHRGAVDDLLELLRDDQGRRGQVAALRPVPERDRWGRFREWALTDDGQYLTFAITQLGLAFIAACTPPTGAHTGAQAPESA